MIRPFLAALLAVASVAALPSSAFAASCGAGAMPPEMFKTYVAGVQEALNEHGFKAGKVDGKAGGQTGSAIRAYQRAAKLPVDGCVSKELLDHLNFAQPKVYARRR
ncbi:peptidoglycan-binding domain-containing protein [Azospirillum griseum]|uniref:Peptidoglycan-binding protein n=1 Tax=Azospirillum griseum TaxID=2496639 RepID=A0A431VPA9_9PROT|nr:peptidoglycan-binding domain-containing protein [Azospirillum griseum]RTR24549.1 peptidoglycan-binding protein [Azospirillum griseum]